MTVFSRPSVTATGDVFERASGVPVPLARPQPRRHLSSVLDKISVLYSTGTHYSCNTICFINMVEPLWSLVLRLQTTRSARKGSTDTKAKTSGDVFKTVVVVNCTRYGNPNGKDHGQERGDPHRSCDCFEI